MITQIHTIVTYVYTPKGKPLDIQVDPRAFEAPADARDHIQTTNQTNHDLTRHWTLADYKDFVEKFNPLPSDDCQFLFQTPDGSIRSANVVVNFDRIDFSPEN